MCACVVEVIKEGPVGPKGDKGDQGIQGIQGPQGFSFNPDVVGPAADRSLYDAQAQGFAFLDQDNALLYFRNSPTVGVWSSAIPFSTVGPQGPAGNDGAPGPQGIQGPVGPAGPPSTLTDLGVTVPASVINENVKNENRIINGTFSVWQRGTVFSTAGYTADRWHHDFLGGTTGVEKAAFTLGQNLGRNNPSSVLRFAVSGQSATSHFSYIRHFIKGVRSYANQTITVCGWARRLNGNGDLAISATQSFGTGGSPSAGVNIPGQVVPLTTNFAPFAVTLTIPDITGKVLGTSNNDLLAIAFWNSAGSDFDTWTGGLGIQTVSIELACVHIRHGAQPVESTNWYVAPSEVDEVRNSQHFYQHLRAAIYMDTPATNSHVGVPVSFFVPMRIAPAASAFQVDVGVNVNSSYPPIVLSTHPEGSYIRAVSAAPGVVHYNAIWAFDSEY